MRLTKGFGVEVLAGCCHSEPCKAAAKALGVPMVEISPLGGPVVFHILTWEKDGWSVVDGGARCPLHGEKAALGGSE